MHVVWSWLFVGIIVGWLLSGVLSRSFSKVTG